MENRPVKIRPVPVADYTNGLLAFVILAAVVVAVSLAVYLERLP